MVTFVFVQGLKSFCIIIVCLLFIRSLIRTKTSQNVQHPENREQNRDTQFKNKSILIRDLLISALYYKTNDKRRIRPCLSTYSIQPRSS